MEHQHGSDTAQRILQIIAEWAGLPLESLTLESKLRDLGIDSMQTASLLAVLEADLGIQCDDDMIGTFMTVRRLEDIVTVIGPAVGATAGHG